MDVGKWDILRALPSSKKVSPCPQQNPKTSNPKDMGGCQIYDPLGTPNIWGRIIIGTQKGTIILTTPHTWTTVLEAYVQEGLFFKKLLEDSAKGSLNPTS